MALTDDDAYIPHLKEGVLRAVLIKAPQVVSIGYITPDTRIRQSWGIHTPCPNTSLRYVIGARCVLDGVQHPVELKLKTCMARLALSAHSDAHSFWLPNHVYLLFSSGNGGIVKITVEHDVVTGS
uniref:hypothetical protein n=1 Tax=Thiolapillus sp. TaxID=2017437 RepID=UPI003AF6C9AE